MPLSMNSWFSVVLSFILSTSNRLYIGTFGVLMFSVLGVATFAFIVAFVFTPVTDIDGIRETLAGSLNSISFLVFSITLRCDVNSGDWEDEWTPEDEYRRERDAEFAADCDRITRELDDIREGLAEESLDEAERSSLKARGRERLSALENLYASEDSLAPSDLLEYFLDLFGD